MVGRPAEEYTLKMFCPILSSKMPEVNYWEDWYINAKVNLRFTCNHYYLTFTIMPKNVKGSKIKQFCSVNMPGYFMKTWVGT